MLSRNLFFALVLSLAFAGSGRLAAMDMPWRPIPELPALLWYTEFDEDATVVKKLYERATIKSGKPNPEGDSMLALGPCGGGNENKEVEAYIKISTTPARFPDKLNPNHVWIQFNVWASEPGKIEVWVRSGLAVNDWQSVPKPNMWCPIKTSLGSLSNKNDRIKPESTVSDIHLKFKPSRAGDKLPEVYVDKFLVCDRMPPERMAFMLAAWQAKMGQLVKTVEKDGFCYDDAAHTTMQKVKLQSKHRGPTLVFLPLAAGQKDPSVLWNDAAQEAKMRGVKFEVAHDPRKLPLSGLDDTRAFLPYLLEKTDAQGAMIVVNKEEALRAGKEIENLRLIFSRLQEAGAAIFLCLPAADEKNKKLDEFLKAAIGLCAELGVPYFDQAFAFKNAKAPYEKEMLTEEGQKALCALMVPAYKHIEDAVSGRRR